MAVGDFLTWAAQGQDPAAHVGRLLQTILLNEGVVDVAGGSFEVTEDTGANMNITIGSGTLGDLAVVEGDDTAGQGVYVIEAQNATVTKTIAASDPSDDRIDLVVLQNYDDEADSSGNNDAEVEVVEGTPAGSPSAPALPDSAIPLAEVLVGAGVTAITNADITDTRSEARARPSVLKLPSAKWVRTSIQGVSNNTQTTLQGPLGADLDEDHVDDPDGVFSISGGVVTVNEAGVFAITSGVQFDNNSTGYRTLRIVKNSTVLASDFSPSSVIEIRLGVSSGPVEFAAGDTFHAESFQNSGSTLDIEVTEFEPFLSVVRIS